ncbi:unnamed protein product [Cuscuta epithymum]|uniref:BHLH domain-containing protein n=1 Tax=Cuscuta epithymum TaxID=186058 RepID=A0AAV0E8P6_9ASTE|nr:unnamed protein product [Cuscuta epithymum]
MADDQYQLGSGGNWWATTSSSSSSCSSSPVSSAVHMSSSHTHSVSMGIRNLGWAAPPGNMVVDVSKSRSSLDSASAASGGALVDPSLQMMGLGLSSQPIDWNPSLFGGEKGEAEHSYGGSMLQGEMSCNANYDHRQLHPNSEEQWRSAGGAMYSGGGGSSDETSACDYGHRPPPQQIGGAGLSRFTLLGHTRHDDDDDEYLATGSSNCRAGQTTSFDLDSSYGNSDPSEILQAGLFISSNVGTIPTPQPPPNYAARTPALSFPYNSTSHSSYGPAVDGGVMSASWSKFPHQFLRSASSPPLEPPPPQQASLNFANNTAFWNATASAAATMNSSFFPSLNTQLQSYIAAHDDGKPTNASSNMKELGTPSSSATAEKRLMSNETSSGKRPRNNESPSPPVPPFKVRKEKMGDRITALQQLVSPFGKTDSASVLTEAIDYIKFLHDQVHILSAPYMKPGSALQHQQMSSEKCEVGGAAARPQDLRRRGLCLVPITSTFPVTHEPSTADFWSPTAFGTTLR